MTYFSKKNWLIFLIFIGVIVIKVYYLNLLFQSGSYSDETAYTNGDAGHYLKIAKNISDYNVYSDNNSNIPSESATWRPPFWPLVLSQFFNFSDNIVVIIILKFLLEIGLLLFILFKIFKNQHINKVYLISFLLIFIEPQYLKYSVTFLTESFTAVLILLLFTFFLSLRSNKRYNIIIPILSSIVVLTHPVSSFFILTLFIVYLLYNLTSNFKIVILHGLIFSIIIMIWPIRNHLTFNKGIYLTASQGATFSKGWNENVSTEFNNVNGDLADETINLKFVDNTIINNANGSIDYSKVYSAGTLNYINSISFKEKLNIILIKIKSNFNPFPERPKTGFLESLSSLFRSVYLIVFIQLFFRLLRKNKFCLDSTKDKIYIVVLAIAIGQVLICSYIYTGLRFNSIYSLTLLCSFIILNSKTISSIIDYIQKQINTLLQKNPL